MAPGSDSRRRGFTLVELLVVMVLLALATGGAVLALRDGDAQQLEREAARLSALLEAARAEARASAVPVRFVLGSDRERNPGAADDDAAAGDFRFDALPPGQTLPNRWLEPQVRAQLQAGALLLGPEPLIPAQQVVLKLGHWQVTLATDGLSPFEPGPVVDLGAP